VRITRTSGERLYLEGAEVRGDSLYGTRGYFVDDPNVALPLSDVARVDAARTSLTVPVLLTLVTVGMVWRWVLLPQLLAD
jgi:hypothetical protein